MPILNSNEIFMTPFEPKQSNRFILRMNNIPAFLIKGVSAVSATQTPVALNHMNVQRFVKGKTKWNKVDLTLFESITPSGAQAVMEWVRLHHESVTGRDGYSDFYKQNLTFQVIGPVGDVVSEWVLMGCIITDVDFGAYNWDDDGVAVNIKLSVQPDYCVLNF